MTTPPKYELTGELRPPKVGEWKWNQRSGKFEQAVHDYREAWPIAIPAYTPGPRQTFYFAPATPTPSPAITPALAAAYEREIAAWHRWWEQETCGSGGPTTNISGARASVDNERQKFSDARHVYQVVGADMAHGEIVSLMRCSRCGKSALFPTIDRQAFNRLFWERGCPGSALTTPPEATK